MSALGGNYVSERLLGRKKMGQEKPCKVLGCSIQDEKRTHQGGCGKLRRVHRQR